MSYAISAPHVLVVFKADCVLRNDEGCVVLCCLSDGCLVHWGNRKTVVYQAGNYPQRKEGLLAEGSNLGALCLHFPWSSYTKLIKLFMLQISWFIMPRILSLSRVHSSEERYQTLSLISGLVQNSILGNSLLQDAYYCKLTPLVFELAPELVC